MRTRKRFRRSHNYLDELQQYADGIANYQLKDEPVPTEHGYVENFPEPSYQNEMDHMHAEALAADPDYPMGSDAVEEFPVADDTNVNENEYPPESSDTDYMVVRDRAMQFAESIPGITYSNVDDWLDAVDKIEAKLTTGSRMKKDD